MTNQAKQHPPANPVNPNPVIKWVNLHFRTLLFLLLIGFFVTGSMDMKDSALLKTPDLPLGTFSWETNTSNQLQRKVLKDWKDANENIQVFKKDSIEIQHLNGLTVALRQNNADYAFIFFYVSLLLLFFAGLYGKGIPVKNIKVYACLAIAAGVMDVLENLGTASVINAYEKPVSVDFVCIPSIIKWGLLLIVVIRLLITVIRLSLPGKWLKDVSVAIGISLTYAWRFRLVLFTLLAYFLVLFISDQGQDLLITINSSHPASICFLLTVTLLALLCWHLPKAIDNARHISFSQFWLGPVDFIPTDTANSKHQRPSAKVDIGRLMGATAFLVPAAGILQTMNLYHIDYWFSLVPPLGMLTAILAFYVIVLRHNWIDRLFKSGDKIKPVRFWAAMLLLLLPIVIWGAFFQNENREPYFLAYLSIDLIILSAAFLVITTLRTCVDSVKDWHIAPWITFSGLLLLIFFIACNFPEFQRSFTGGDRFYTMPVVFTGLAGYLLFFSYLLFAGKKTGITFITFLLIITLYQAINKITNYHDAKLISEQNYKRAQEPLESYAEHWLQSRHDDIQQFTSTHKNKTYPVFFVNAFGGGIRATVWTTLVFGTLDSLVINGDNNNPRAKDFQHYVFSCSGASGGTIGLSLIAGARYPYLDMPGKDRLFYPGHFLQVYHYDFLTADIVGLMGRDMLASSLGLSSGCWDDRARLMERDFEMHTGANNVYLAARVGRIWANGKYELPLFFANTYDVITGKKGIISPALLDIADFPNTIPIEQQLKENDDLRLSTAAFFSARFPYVSPTAKIYGNSHFTDGGTWDNSGGETSLQVMQVFKRALAKLALSDAVYRKIKLQFVSLPNSIAANTSVRQDNLFEPLAPPAGILKLGDGIERKAVTVNQITAEKDSSGYFTIQPTAEPINEKKKIWPILPLGWQISDFAMAQMRISVLKNQQVKEIYKLFQ